jgi:enamine deaminase RidA (YjgF/YER057c/UK114 family)
MFRAKRLCLLAMLLLSLVTPTDAQTKRTRAIRKFVMFVNPPTLAKPTGYTHAVIAIGRRTIYIAGQVALDQSGNIVGKDDFRAQAQQVFENLKKALEGAGASFKHVVKLNYFVLDMKQIQTLREVRNAYVNTEAPPASTLVEVRRLAREEFLIEVEAIAVVAP